MSGHESAVARFRQQRGWTQAALAERCRVSRAEISGIETGRFVPSVLVGLRLADVLGVPIEHLFGGRTPDAAAIPWAWLPRDGDPRAWRATVGKRLLAYPVEPTAAGHIPHDAVAGPAGLTETSADVSPDRTLVIAGCDPTVGLLVSAMARHGIRVLPVLRSSHQALELLRQGVVHVAGIHFAHAGNRSDNAHVAASVVGSGHHLINQMEWQTGIALTAGRPERSTRALLAAQVRWVNREEGSGARYTFDRLLGRRARPRGYNRIVRGHREVAATVSSGWAEAGVCVRPAAEEHHLSFIALQEESYELCFADSLLDDTRLSALESVLRSRSHRCLLAGVPGCTASRSGERQAVRPARA